MARITNMGNDVDIKWIHNVSYAVGPRCTNAQDDVMLVQHLLNKLMATLGLRSPTGVLITEYLRRDGIFGPKTQTLIGAYQLSLRARGRLVATDARIDPANPSGWTKAENQYTIVHLNRDHLKVYGRMADDTEFPPPVVAALKRNKING